MSYLSRRIQSVDAAFAPVSDFYFRSRWAERRFEAGVSDLTFGNPQEMPLPGLVEAIRAAAQFHTLMIDIKRVTGEPITALSTRSAP